MPPPAHSSATSLPSISEDMSSTSSAVTTTINTMPSAPETHSCPYNDCNKSFSKKYNLKAHLRLHTGEQPFECDRPDCRKKFKWRSSLSSHSVWHSRKDNANASTPSTTTKSSATPSKVGCQQKTAQSRPVRVAPLPSTRNQDRRGATNNSSVSASASASSPNCRKKRPRSDSYSSSLHSTNSLLLDHTGLISSSSDVMRAKSSTTRSSAKKRRARPTTATTRPETKILEGEDDEDVFVAPGSPVTSDGSNSEEQALDVDDFSCDILQPLLSRGEALELGTEEGQLLFGFEENGSYVPLSGFDSRFEQFDLDNLASFYLNSQMTSG